MTAVECEILVFEIAGTRFGLPGSAVQELLRAVKISPLPRSSELIEGVINLRGKIVPVLNLRRWLGLPDKVVEPSDHFIVVRTESRSAVLRVDRALDLVKCAGLLEEPADPPTSGDGKSSVAKLPDGLLVLPNLHGLYATADAVDAPNAEVTR